MLYKSIFSKHFKTCNLNTFVIENDFEYSHFMLTKLEHYSTTLLADECLKHSYDTRVGFSFSGLFYSNFIVFVARLLIWCLGWMQVHWSKKGSFWKHFWKQWGAKQESGCHVVTFQRRDVPTSRRFQRRDVGSTNAEVNNLKRRDASTSRRPNVATSQRRDVSSRSAPHHLKYEWLRNQGIERRTNKGTEF